MYVKSHIIYLDRDEKRAQKIQGSLKDEKKRQKHNNLSS